MTILLETFIFCKPCRVRVVPNYWKSANNKFNWCDFTSFSGDLIIISCFWSLAFKFVFHKFLESYFGRVFAFWYNCANAWVYWHKSRCTFQPYKRMMKIDMGFLSFWKTNKQVHCHNFCHENKLFHFRKQLKYFSQKYKFDDKTNLHNLSHAVNNLIWCFDLFIRIWNGKYLPVIPMKCHSWLLSPRAD